MSNIRIKKGDVGSRPLQGKFLSPLDPDYVRGVLRRLMPGICIGKDLPVYHNGRWNWDAGWWVAIQDGLYLIREENEFRIYWETE